MADTEDRQTLSSLGRARRASARSRSPTRGPWPRCYTENREFLAPLEPLRPEVFYTYEGQRRHIAQLTDRRTAGTAYPFVIVLNGQPVG